ncbi:MAG: DUF1800 domain-containing protein [Planctomycetaceae bacterium]|nr:DUF1800 domain-containing protein [Planctomycetaceae bacterium]
MNFEIDPEWAWREYSPDNETPWNLRTASHLFRRLGFGASQKDLDAALQRKPSELVDDLLNINEPVDFQREMKSLADSALATGNVKQLSAWWAYRMLASPAQALEKTTLFWHGHFATSAEKVTEGQLMLTQNELLRRYAFGDFSQMLLEISRDAAMLIYLDSATNRKAHPNENYAREIMELFCLGEGNYSETDIRELARCFTGWEVRRGEFRFNRFQHDTGTKNILGKSGDFGGEDGVRIVLEQKSAPEFLVSKLIRYFVMDEPAASRELIAPLAKEMRESGMKIRPVLRRILTSQLFYSPLAIGRKIKSPVEMAIGLLRSLEGTTNSFELAESLQQLGQGLLYPPSVKGWDGGRTWINSSTLLGRSNLVRDLITHEKTRFGRTSLKQYLASQKVTQPRAIIDHLEERLFAVAIPEAAKDRIARLMAAASGKAIVEGLHALCTLPEFQIA